MTAMQKIKRVCIYQSWEVWEVEPSNPYTIRLSALPKVQKFMGSYGKRCPKARPLHNRPLRQEPANFPESFGKSSQDFGAHGKRSSPTAMRPTAATSQTSHPWETHTQVFTVQYVLRPDPSDKTGSELPVSDASRKDPRAWRCSVSPHTEPPRGRFRATSRRKAQRGTGNGCAIWRST